MVDGRYQFFLLTLSPRQKEVRFLVALVCLSVCLSVCGRYSKSYEWLGIKFYGGVLGSTTNN